MDRHLGIRGQGSQQRRGRAPDDACLDRRRRRLRHSNAGLQRHHLRMLYPSTAIIISTGYGEIDPGLTARANIAGYLAKPYDRESLLASLERALVH